MLSAVPMRLSFFSRVSLNIQDDSPLAWHDLYSCSNTAGVFPQAADLPSAMLLGQDHYPSDGDHYLTINIIGM